jgi:zinc protease
MSWRPAPAIWDDVAVLPTRVFKLRNGLTVVVQTDRSAPLVAVSLTYRVGSLDEERGRGGFAHLFEHLMFQGTRNLPPNEISRLVETNGGVDNAYTMKTNTT